MKKLYTGIAAVALAATGLACGTGAAHADTTGWPDGFTASGIASTTDAVYEVGSYYVEADDSSGYDLVQIAHGAASLVDLGTDAEPLAIAAHGDTLYVTGKDTDYNTVLWTVVDGAITDTRVLNDLDWPTSVAVSPDADGSKVAVADQYGVEVLPAAGGAPEMISTLDADDDYGTSRVTFSGDGDSVVVAIASDDNAIKAWTLPATGEAAPGDPVTILPASDEYPMLQGLVGGADGTAYVAINDTASNDGIYAVKGGAATRTQQFDRISGLALSADGSALYALGYYSVQSFPIDSSKGAPTFYSTQANPSALTVTADGSLAVAEQREDGTNLVESIKASSLYPGVPAGSVTITGTPKVGSTLTASTSGWPTGTTFSYQWGAVVSHGESGGLEPLTGATSATLALTPAFAGKKIVVTVTGHLDSVHNDTEAYSSIVTVAAATTTTDPTPRPAHVTTIKPSKLTSSSKQLTLTLPGIASAPGKVKVFDGKKLIGKATIKNGKLVLKLKKKLHRGKHKLTVKYAGSAQVAEFTKTVKVKVK